MNVYETGSLAEKLRSNTYPGRGIVLGLTADGTHSVAAYFIMGRSQNSRNRVFVEEPDGIRTQAYDPAKLADPSLIIYHPVRQFGRADRHQRRPDRHHPGRPAGGQELHRGPPYPLL